MLIRNSSRKHYDQWEILNSKVDMLNEFGSNTEGYYGAIVASVSLLNVMIGIIFSLFLIS